VLPLAALGFGLTAAAQPAPAQELPFSEARLFFELNNTDGDLGIHGKIDGDAWKALTIEDPNGRNMAAVQTRGRLTRQGLTEIFFESAEPSFDELDPADFFARFPEGTYEVEGVTLDGEELEGEMEVTHVMPAPPETSVNGESEAEQCDAAEPGYDAPQVTAPITIAWDEITMSHPDADGGGAGVQPPVPVTIVNYEVVVSTTVEIDGEEFDASLDAILPPGVTEFALPDSFAEMGDTFKYEVLAREESDNQTATESCFELTE
jgi:hypothetical protein